MPDVCFLMLVLPEIDSSLLMDTDETSMKAYRTPSDVYVYTNLHRIDEDGIGHWDAHRRLYRP